MQDTWREQVDNIAAMNILWHESQEMMQRWKARRDDAAVKLEEILKAMVDQAQKIHGTTNIKPEPIVESGKMVGLKLWINDICHIYKNEKM